MNRFVWAQDDLLAEEAIEESLAAAGDAEVVVLDAAAGIDGIEEAVFAGSLFVAKLLLLLGIGAIGLATDWIDPISLAAGAATLPVAIVLDTCYVAWVNHRPAREPGALGP